MHYERINDEKIIRFLLIMMLSLALVACGSKNGGETKEPDDNNKDPDEDIVETYDYDLKLLGVDVLEGDPLVGPFIIDALGFTVLIPEDIEIEAFSVDTDEKNYGFRVYLKYEDDSLVGSEVKMEVMSSVNNLDEAIEMLYVYHRFEYVEYDEIMLGEYTYGPVTYQAVELHNLEDDIIERFLVGHIKDVNRNNIYIEVQEIVDEFYPFVPIDDPHIISMLESFKLK